MFELFVIIPHTERPSESDRSGFIIRDVSNPLSLTPGNLAIQLSVAENQDVPHGDECSS